MIYYISYCYWPFSGQVLLNVPAAVSEERLEKLLEVLLPRALADESPDDKDRKAAAKIGQ